jgi:ASTRA-associated protein 1
VSAGDLGELIDIYSLPNTRLTWSAIGKNPQEKLGTTPRLLLTKGMTMSLNLIQKHSNPEEFILAAAYESGHVALYSLPSPSNWSTIYIFKTHTQPSLSVAIHPFQNSFLSSAADATIAEHPLAGPRPLKSVNTKHAGQTSLSVRPDGRIFVTAGWDGVGRVYSTRTLRQVGVLKWHDGGLQTARFVGEMVVLGGKDGKVSLWDVFN